ncbi:MAG: hypothetical protein ACOX9E_05675 [Lentisphaeria bacterium]|jgi:hypothetical protein
MNAPCSNAVLMGEITSAAPDNDERGQAIQAVINHVWRCKLSVKTDKDGRVAFRGFRGNYHLSRQDAAGKNHSALYALR